MAFVVDASVAASWWLPDEVHAGAHALLRRLATETALAPALWWYEIRNVLLVAERRGRIDAAGSARFVSDLEFVNLEIDREPRSTSLLMLARQHQISGYDAAYLELALRRGTPLATLDQRLAFAAQTEGIATLPA